MRNVSERLLDNLQPLLRHLDIEYIEYPNRCAFACPVHGGDNPEACVIFTSGSSQSGNWNCWTRGCEQEFNPTLLGFVRGVLINNSGNNVSLNDAVDYCLEFLNKNIKDLNTEEEKKNDDSAILDIFHKTVEKQDSLLSRDKIRSQIEIPASYYIRRGYAKETLDTFDVGLCVKKNKPMSGRIVVPIYDEDYNYIGCVGRSVKEDLNPKWLHSKGFKKSILYGLNIARSHIIETNTVFLLEGQGDVWRMHEAGYKNSVGIFGSSLNDDQVLLLEQSGALNLVILTDFDQAGEKAAQQIVKKCGRRFNYYRPNLSSKDVGDMPIDLIHKELNPQLREIHLI